MELIPQIRRGMIVYDSVGAEIGVVKWVYPAPEMVQESCYWGGVKPHGEAAHPLYPSFATVLTHMHAPNDLPLEALERLWRVGFIQLEESNPHAASRYISGDQIGSVAGPNVYLNAPRQHLKVLIAFAPQVNEVISPAASH